MARIVTHISTDGDKTYCGLRVSYLGGGRSRRVPLTCIDLKRVSLESATCRACGRSDDARSIQNHRRECRASGLDPDSMLPLPKKAQP